MKKVLSLVLVLLIALSALSVTAFADGLIEYTVYVTIADDHGDLVVVEEPISVGGVAEGTGMPIFAALKNIHDRFYEGGSEAGFAVERTEYGTSLVKLWGVENGGSYGYYVNNKAARSLDDTLYTGDHLYAFVYQDPEKWTDRFSYFDQHTAEVSSNESFELTYMIADYDDDWNPVDIPASNAVITVDGEETSFVTDENGKVTISISEEGRHIVSAKDAQRTLAPPVAVVTVSEGKLLGDADRDGVISVMDATCIQKYKANLITEDKIDLSVSDVDNDGSVSVLDATRIQKYKAKICELDGTPIEAQG